MTDTAVRLPRLKQQYRETIVKRLQEELGFENVMQVPGLTKIIVNIYDCGLNARQCEQPLFGRGISLHIAVIIEMITA